MSVNELLLLLDKLFASYGYSIVFFSSFVEITPLGWTIPGGGILAAGGFFSYGKDLNLAGVILAGGLGAWATFLLAYVLGKRTGNYLVKKLSQEENAKKAKILLKKHGAVILTTSMMANLIRFWVAYVAGTQKYNLYKFLFYSLTASFAWSSLMIVTGYLAGNQRDKLETGIARLGIVSWGIIVAALAIVYVKTKKEFEEFSEELEE